MQIGCIWQLFKSHRLVAVGVAALLAEFFVVGLAPSARALPSFARQTGQPCGTCHTDFPGLTPYGRRFKLMGYTVGGGKYRTTPFPTYPIVRDPALDNLANYMKAIVSYTATL